MLEAPQPVAERARSGGPIVEAAPGPAVALDPLAAPTTPLGELRARYLPVWSPEFDWAFPPEVCGSDWPLDGVAAPAADADPAVLGDGVAAAALSVMRYEHLLSAAFAEPEPLAQLCVAVASVGEARRDALELLAAHLSTGAAAAGSRPEVDTPDAPRPRTARRAERAAVFPHAVYIVARSPQNVLAVACTDPPDRAAAAGAAPVDPAGRGEAADSDDIAQSAGSDVDGAAARGGDGGAADPGAGETAEMSAYLLALSHGLEDAVVDVSYRVSGVVGRSAESCEELDSWRLEWAAQAQRWEAEGLLWRPLDRTVTVAELCDSPPPGGPDECPRDWRR